MTKVLEGRQILDLEHFPAKRTPVRVKKMRQNKGLESFSDSIRSEKALGTGQAASFAALLLAQSGADVIKFESVSGDPLRPADFFDCEANRASRLVASFSHPAFGHFEHIGAFWDFGDLGVRLERAPPLLGQHSAEILAELAFSPQEADAFVAAELVKGCDTPRLKH
jgi:crotonobetainyl-CoA:carnitine CoA-transferase CaiB-like acyl-CoA transferase